MGGNSFIFFYDNDELRICNQKPGAKFHSSNDYFFVLSYNDYTFWLHRNKQ